MPTVLRVGGARFFFYSSDGPEPPHVHVESGDLLVKFWLDPVTLDPVTLAGAARTRRHRIRRIEALVVSYREVLLESWHEFFGT